MGEIRYNYKGQQVGFLSKVFSDVVVIQDDWIATVNKQFADQGYSAILKAVKHWVREAHGEELTDAQAWSILIHITSGGVPAALRDAESDEGINPAKYVAGSAIGLMDKAVNTTTGVVMGASKAVTQPFTKKDSAEETEE
tara:strand:+ start:235 stop:654 length:420 start_codon:yes stop_codon:yes gene_type:complete